MSKASIVDGPEKTKTLGSSMGVPGPQGYRATWFMKAVGGMDPVAMVLLGEHALQ